jgi:hypothetical protein
MLHPALIAVLNGNLPARHGHINHQDGQQDGKAANHTKLSVYLSHGKVVREKPNTQGLEHFN